MVTDAQWKIIIEKWGLLIFTIARRISGDNAIADFDENVADLHEAALDAIIGYEKQGGNGTLEDFLETEGFGKYMKTCLWNKKNSKGKGIKKRYPIHSSTISVSEFEEIIEDKSAVESELTESDDFMEVFRKNLSEKERELIELILNHPGSIKQNGTLNVAHLVTLTGERWNTLQDRAYCLGIKLKGRLVQGTKGGHNDCRVVTNERIWAGKYYEGTEFYNSSTRILEDSGPKD